VTVHSMTAYARTTQNNDHSQWTWEIKSVNHRYLECHIRLPEAYKAIEIELRNRLKKNLHRGKVDISLQVSAVDQAHTIQLNPSAIKHLFDSMALVNQLAPTGVAPLQLTLNDLLKWPGMTEVQNSQTTEQINEILESFEKALGVLKTERAREGEALKTAISERLPGIYSIAQSLSTSVPEMVQHQRDRLEQRIAELGTEFQPERLAQELILYAQKIDIAEEIDRIKTHVKEIEQMLTKGGCIGRRLDFLLQELNREANTVGSKAVHIQSSQSSVNLKVLIEQMREQTQNIE